MGFVGKNKAEKVSYYISNNNKERYYLEIDVNNNPLKPVIVIMKNPSKTCNNGPVGKQSLQKFKDKYNCKIDRTTGKVYRKLKGLGYDKIIILNLYSLYAVNPILVQLSYYVNNNCDFKENDLEIKKILSLYRNADVICAWGNHSSISKKEYDKRIRTVLHLIGKRRMLKYNINRGNFISYKFFPKGYPLHGLKWK